MNEEAERARFEEVVFVEFFARSVSFTSGQQWASVTEVTKAELCARKLDGHYAREEVLAMWFGWTLRAREQK